MSAIVTLGCDWPGCRTVFARNRADSDIELERAAASYAGWSTAFGDAGDDDLCPEHAEALTSQ